MAINSLGILVPVLTTILGSVAGWIVAKKKGKVDWLLRGLLLGSSGAFLVAIGWALYNKYCWGASFWESLWVTGDLLSFLATVILGVIVYLQEKNYRKREEEKGLEEERKKIQASANIIYWDFRYAFIDIISFFGFWLKPHRGYPTGLQWNVPYEDFTDGYIAKNLYREAIVTSDLMGKIRRFIQTSQLYLVDNWIQNTTTLALHPFQDEISMDVIYRLYQHLLDFNHLLKEYHKNAEEQNDFGIFYVSHLEQYFMETEEGKLYIDVILDALKEIGGVTDNSLPITELWRALVDLSKPPLQPRVQP